MDILNMIEAYCKKLEIDPKEEKRKLRKMNLDPEKLAAILGYLIGDGYIDVIETKIKKRAYRIEFYSKNKIDLVKIRNDIKFISGYKGTLYYRESKRNWTLSYDSRTLFILFQALGVPIGDKTNISFVVPSIIKDGEKSIKKAFLSGLFSAEMDKPAVRSGKKTRTIKPIQMEMRKIQKNEENLKFFFHQLKQILSEFEINSKIYKRTKKYLRKDKKTTVTYVLSINDTKSIKTLLEKIGYIYNHERQKLARKMLEYIKLKEETIKKRREIAKKSLELFKQGYTPSQTIKKLQIAKEHQRLVKELYRKYKKGIKIDISKIRINRRKFPRFNDL
ncbi:MAG: LAGLIDADG family homing endonuclease [Candidatus Njordarchaeia archaeon]